MPRHALALLETTRGRCRRELVDTDSRTGRAAMRRSATRPVRARTFANVAATSLFNPRDHGIQMPLPAPPTFALQSKRQRHRQFQSDCRLAACIQANRRLELHPAQLEFEGQLDLA